MINIFRMRKELKKIADENQDLRRKIKVLELENSRKTRLISENKDLSEQVDILEKKLRGDRICDGYCENCTHSVPMVEISRTFGVCKSYKCVLNCKCKDFSQKQTAREMGKELESDEK